MLEDYFVRPQTVERIRSLWIGSAIEQYLARLEEQGYATGRLAQRVPILVRFGEFAQTQGAHSYAELPIYLNPFVEFWVKRRRYRQSVTLPRSSPADAVTRRIEAMLRVVVPGFVGHTRRRISNRLDPKFTKKPNR